MTVNVRPHETMTGIQRQRPPAVVVGAVSTLRNNHHQHDLPLSVLGRVSGSQNGPKLALDELKPDICAAAGEGSCHVGSLTCDSDQEVVVFDNSPAGSAVSGIRSGRDDEGWVAETDDVLRHAHLQHQSLHVDGDRNVTVSKMQYQRKRSDSDQAQQPTRPTRHHLQHTSKSATTTPLKATALGSQALSPLNPHWQNSPALSCASVPTPHHPCAAMSAANSNCSFSTQSMGSCNGLGLPHVVKKYKRAKSLLQAHLHEVQRLKGVVAAEEQKAAAAAEQARVLEGQLAASTAAVVEARLAQQDLQQQVNTPATMLQVPHKAG